jgi:hypothetical protein
MSDLTRPAPNGRLDRSPGVAGQAHERGMTADAEVGQLTHVAIGQTTDAVAAQATTAARSATSIHSHSVGVLGEPIDAAGVHALSAAPPGHLPARLRVARGSSYRTNAARQFCRA